MSGVLTARASGVLLHPTSFAGGPIGDLGPAAYEFVDWLVGAGQSYWQILPLIAVDDGGSPYNGLTAAAGNPLLISLDLLVDDGLLTAEEASPPDLAPGAVDFPAVGRWKRQALGRAYRALVGGASPAIAAELEEYRRRNAAWLGDYSLFRALRDENAGSSWTDWEEPLRSRRPEALAAARLRLADEVGRLELEQLLFDRQWGALRSYARARGVKVIGDIPIFVAQDSADVWANQELFELDERGLPVVVSGVPPDYFSEAGQRWGNPLYRWDVLRARGYDWWVERIRRALTWVDVVRIDHFRGFEAYWEIPATEETAVKGRWRKGPGAEFFRAAAARLGDLPVIAEDLGLITEEVDELREELDYPGMRVLEFGFDGEADNPHLPGNYPPHAVVYTGTHDNDTLVGWWEKASPLERATVEQVLELPIVGTHWAFISLVLESKADLAILPVQDVLGLGSEARMNTPGTIHGNWVWRLSPGALTVEAQRRLREATERSRRAPRAAGVEPALRVGRDADG